MLTRIPEHFHAVDSHNHCWAGRPNCRNVKDGKLDLDYMNDTLANADRYGIERLGISCPVITKTVEPEAFRGANDVILQAMELHPDRFIGYCFVDPNFPRAAVEEIRRCHRAGMKGIKLYHQKLICDEAQRPIMEVAAELGRPVLMHAGKIKDEDTQRQQPLLSNAEHFLKALEMFPNTILIQAHIGGGGDWEWNLRVLEGLRNPNYYIDLSGSVCDVGIARRTVDAVGLDSVLFATDMSFAESVSKVLNSGFTENELQALLHDNFTKLEARLK